MNTTNTNQVKQTNTKNVNGTHRAEYVNDKLVKKMHLCQAFTRMTYANVIIGAVLYIITVITLFWADVMNPNNPWLGFWVVKPESTIISSLSAFAIAIIVFDSIWLASYIVQFVANVALHNKVKLVYVPKILIAFSISILLMLILGICCEPSYPAAITTNWVYISWMRTLSFDGVKLTTSLTSGAIIILLEMVLIYVACIAFTIYYHISKVKKNKSEKQQIA